MDAYQKVLEQKIEAFKREHDYCKLENDEHKKETSEFVLISEVSFSSENGDVVVATAIDSDLVVTAAANEQKKNQVKIVMLLLPRPRLLILISFLPLLPMSKKKNQVKMVM